MIELIPASYDTYELSKNERLKFFFIVSLSMLLVSYLFYSSILLSIISLFCCLPMQKYYKKYLAKKRKHELNNQFRDALYSISASISVGRQMPEALLEARDNMKVIYSENAPIVMELSYIVKRFYVNRESEETILRDFAKRSDCDDIKNFVDVYFTCRVTGGDLEKVVMKAAQIIMDKISINKEIKTLTAQKKFEAKILTAIPLIIILFLRIISPDYLRVMYETFIGRIIMTVSLIAIGAAYYLSNRITDIKV
ncbi:type II secretion system F family protein [Anaerovorax odorimutans]|uniref:type II secretion system F family protein n=1 Tax=Anaerovorax odorimutans TaxID=109327 RepID=UPI0006846F87|nr:type II secretion system F family protein [Anaerovorax odorimutans]